METWFPGQTTLNVADYLLLTGFIAALFLVGFKLGKSENSTSDFFLARRSIPWWAACLSFVATEISAMTIIGVPATAFRENWNYAQFFIGSTAARITIAYLFIPAFYQHNCTTIYEFLRHRFGPETQYMATAFFFITRLLASGVRLMAACVAVSVLMGWHIVPVILMFSAISIVYIGFGGIKAVVWTNVLQALTFIGAGLATLMFLGVNIEGGLSSVWALAGPPGRLKLWNMGPGLGEAQWLTKFFSDPNILWIAILNGFFGSMAAFGTDHELMQRLLTVETRKESQNTMLMTIVGSFAVLLIFLSVGTGIFVYYAQHPDLVLPAKLDKIYPHFATQAMPQLLRGLILSAIFMASIDSPLSSLSSSFVTDLYKPLWRRDASDEHYVYVSRVSILFFGLALAVIAYVFSFYDKMLWLAFKINGVTAGSLLGVFLLGLMTQRRANRANTAAMIIMALTNLLLLVLSERKVIALAWSWLIILGSVGTFALAWLLGPLLDRERAASKTA